jgi:competence ComEA-like helix-hairpin-helix protein
MSGDPFKLRRLRALVMVSFGFSRSEARAFIILLPLIFVIVFIQPVYRTIFSSGKPDNLADTKQLDSLLATFRWALPDSTTKASKHALYHFDPNTINAVGMDSLGIPRRVGERIDRYRIKGGRFRIKSDLKKIYGFDSALYVRLESYIDLPSRYQQGRSEEKKSHPAPKKVGTTVKTTEIFDLNVADTAVFDKVYGIGPTLAKRIVAYRERLGGFVLEEQLYEVWGLDSVVAKRAMEQSDVHMGFVPRRININTAAETELASHPYIRPKIARVIVTYRFQHGNFSSIEDLGKIYSFEPKNFDRIKPYLTLE